MLPTAPWPAPLLSMASQKLPWSDGQGKVFVNITDKDQIVEFDAQTLKILHRWPLAPGEGPSGLAIDQKNRRLFSVCDNQKLVVMDADTGK